MSMSQQSDPAELTQFEPVFGALRIVGGVRRGDAAPYAAVLSPPPRAAHGREGDCLLLLLDLSGPASPHLYRELREVMAQTYWATEGSITAALREATTAANRHLFQFNLQAAPTDRCYGGLTCAVLHGEDLFILQAGPACACVLRGDYLARYPEGEELPHLGMGPLADVRLYHNFVALGDTLLLASPALLRVVSNEAVARVLPRVGVQEVLVGLEQVGAGADFAALVVRLAAPSTVAQQAVAAARVPVRPPLRRERPAASLEVEGPPPESAVGVRRWAIEPARPRERPVSRPSLRSGLRRAGPGLGKRFQNAATTVGHWIAAAGMGLAGGLRTLFRRVLPGPEREARRRMRPSRKIPQENRVVMMGVAIGVPVIVVIIVVMAYSSFGRQARFQSLIHQARQEAVLAQAPGIPPEEARSHWQAVLDWAGRAAGQKPDDAEAAALQTQARAALDGLDGIVRLNLVQLDNLGPGTIPRQLIVHGQMLFVLDPAAGWVIQLNLNQTGDGVVEQGGLPIVHTGQQVGNTPVGNLVDCTWVDASGGRQTSGLFVLEENGTLVIYDPAWGGEGGEPQATRAFLGTPPGGIPGAMASYDGRLYILDPAREQLLLYMPQGDSYPNPPENYFLMPPPRSLTTVLDLAIDGNIYILFAEGVILKYRGREPQPFEARGVPDGLGQAIALAVDPLGTSGAVYVADRGCRRIIVLGPDGVFQRQFRADGAFDALEALAVDEVSRRLYVLDGGRLYVASLP